MMYLGMGSGFFLKKKRHWGHLFILDKYVGVLGLFIIEKAHVLELFCLYIIIQSSPLLYNNGILSRVRQTVLSVRFYDLIYKNAPSKRRGVRFPISRK